MRRARARTDRRSMGAAAEEDTVAEADLADPNPDVEELFRHYDALYFQGALGAADFAVKWGSSSLLSCSFGSCTFSKPSNIITLSEPVLKYRSSTDLKKALLHEMIHAIIYVKHARRDCRQHGPVFRAWMNAIDSCSLKDPQRPVSGYNITTRHDFRPEKPFSFKGLLWKCEACGDTFPRASNLGPPSDACCIENNHDATCGNILCRWHNHKSDCGGSYKSMGLQSVVQKKVPTGTQLLLTYPSETSKSKGAIKESNSGELHDNTKVTKPNVEDEHISLSPMKTFKRRRSEAVQKAIVLAVEPPKEVKPKQALVAMEKQKAIVLAFEPPEEVKPNQALVAMEKQKAIVLAVEPPKEMKPKQALVAMEKQKAILLAVEPPKEVKPKEALVAMEKQKAIVLAVEPPKEVKQRQALVALDKHGLFSPVGCNGARSLGIRTSKKTGRQHKPEDVQKLNVPTERHKHFSLDGCSNGESLESNSLQKTGKRRRSEIVEKASILPDEPSKEMNRKQALVARMEHNLFSPEGCNDATSPENGTSEKASMQHKPEDIQNLVPIETHNLFSLESCNDARTPGSINAKKASKQHKPEGVQGTSAPPATSEGKPKLTGEFVTTEMHKLSSLEACNYAKSPGTNTSKQADEQRKPTCAQKACPQHAYPLRRLKRDPVATEKNELDHVMGCSNTKLLDKSSSKKARKHHKPEGIQKTTVLQAVPGRKQKESGFVASQKQQRKCRRQPARKKEYAVMSAWMNIYESDGSSGSTEPLVNKRTVRRKKERERIQIYSQSKRKANSPPLDNSRIDISGGGHKSVKDESAQQSWPRSPCCRAVVPVKAEQVVTQATGSHSQTSAPCWDIVPLQPADAPLDSIPPGSAIIDISDDD